MSSTADFPLVVRLAGIGSAVVVLVVLLVTVVVPSQARDAAAGVVAGAWACDLDYTATDENPEVTTRWEVEFFEDGTVEVEDNTGEQAEGEWRFEAGQLVVDFGDAELGNPELTTEAIDIDSSLDEIVLSWEPTDSDVEEEVGARTLTCERDP